MFLSRFFNKSKPTGIQANSIQYKENKAIVDVRGQTCPGYLLAINKAVEAIQPETEIDLLISYPPCGDDVKAWCKEREIKFLSLDKEAEEKRWVIRIKK
ncbi:hypothetical protein MNBD_GAMMA23-2518 [hydrothermal vent metagenome]|uniref:UPF0033 domain-containing protein n=1 Tax=hydrothermal vent metagenome TaxID=652676 RepID=A0A3B0ZW83_9ZZZZ